jgi:ankyrin repeat protein
MHEVRLLAILAISIVPFSPAQGGQLVDAVRAGRYTEALNLLDNGADPNERDTRGYTPLMWAATSGNIQVATALLDKQAFVDGESDRGTVLRLAAENRQTQMVDFLLSRGAQPDIRPPFPAQYRQQMDRIWNFVYSVENAAWAHNSQLVRTLIQQSAADSRQCVLNATLWVAARDGNAPLVGELLQMNANPLSGAIGLTALEAAGEFGHVEVVKLLMARGIRRELVRDAVSFSGARYPEGWYPFPVTAKVMTPALQEAFGDTAREPEAIAAALKTGDAVSLSKLIESGAYDFWVPRTDFFRLRALHLEQAKNAGYVGIVRLLNAISTDETLKDVLQRIKAASEKHASQDHTRIIDIANWYLDQLAHAQWSPKYSREYFVSLQSMADTLENSSGTDVVKEIADDLGDKRDFCVRNHVDMGGSVKVQVRTRQQDKEVSNWQVYFLLRIYETNPSAAPGAFLRWSSPTSEEIEPGRYFFWAENPSTKAKTERKLVPLHEGQTAAVDLLVP